jgi:hypothetical protein
VVVEIDYRLDPSQVGHNAPDLDNLLKATIDALDGVLGPRARQLESTLRPTTSASTGLCPPSGWLALGNRRVPAS